MSSSVNYHRHLGHRSAARSVSGAVLVVVALIGLGACGSSGKSDKVKNSDQIKSQISQVVSSLEAANPHTTATAGGGNSGGSSMSSADCAAAKAAASRLIVPIQMLVGLKTPQAFQQLTTKGSTDLAGMKLNVDQVLADLQSLHAFDGYNKPPFGSPKEGLDKYQAAFEAVKKLASEGTPTQAEVDEFQSSKVGSAADLIKGQEAFSAALGETCQ